MSGSARFNDTTAETTSASANTIDSMSREDVMLSRTSVWRVVTNALTVSSTRSDDVVSIPEGDGTDQPGGCRHPKVARECHPARGEAVR